MILIKNRLYLIIILGIIAPLSTMAQVDTVQIPVFKDLEPLWTYHYEDINAPIDSFKYRHMSTLGRRFYFNETDIIVYTSTFTDLSSNGNVIFKLDKNTGEEKCRVSYNTFTGLQLEEVYRTINYKDGIFKLKGVQQVDPSIDLGIVGWSSTYGEPYRYKIREVDMNTCAVTKEFSNMQDTIGYRTYRPGNAKFIEIGMNSYLGYHANNFYNAKYVFTNIDSLLIPDSSSLRELIVLDNDPTMYVLHNFMFYIQNKRLMSFVYKSLNTSLSTPEVARILYFNTDDRDNIFIEHDVDITAFAHDEAPVGRHPFQAHYNTEESDFLVGYYYVLGQNNFKYWMVWLDSEGNIKNNFHEISVDGHQYIFLRRIKLTDKYLDALAYPTSSGLPGYDVVRIGVDGSVAKVGEVLTEGDVTLIAAIHSDQYDDKVLYSAKTEAGNMIIYAFNAKDLGLDEASAVDEEKIFAPAATKIVAYPNPASDIVYFKLPHSEKYSYHIASVKGDVVATGNVDGGSDEVSLDVSRFESGIYFVSFMDRSGKVYTAQLMRE